VAETLSERPFSSHHWRPLTRVALSFVRREYPVLRGWGKRWDDPPPPPPRNRGKSDLTLLLVTGAVDWPEPLTAGRFGQAASRTRQVPDTSTRIPRRALSRPFCVPADEPLFWSGPGIRAGREKARCLLRNNFPWSRSSWPFSAASGSETGPIVLAAKALGE
jgi:hypothetical protein